jgi:hypothetical protein
MTEEQKKSAIRKMLQTPEGRAKLAASMRPVFRCGGCDYRDGKRYYMIGGQWRPVEEDDQGTYLVINGTKHYRQW